MIQRPLSQSFRAWILLSLFVIAGVTFVSRTVSAASCVGKPYGAVGCPLKSQIYHVPNSCGDGVIDSDRGEECDDGASNGQTECKIDCRLNTCGDGVLLSQVEECEPPAEELYGVDEEGHLIVERRFSPLPMCGKYCAVPTCVGDQCDGCYWVFRNGCSKVDLPSSSSKSSKKSSSIRAVSVSSGSGTFLSATGALLSQSGSTMASSGAVKSASASIAASFSVSSARASLSSVASSGVLCGNGKIEVGEECDDGNTISTDACTQQCTLPMCGDGITQAGEECDDGNTSQKDSCNNYCRFPVCGNNIIEGAEECDEKSDPQCTSTCTISTCGDATVQPGEQCDSGAGNSDSQKDACRTSCKRSFCGDGVIDTGEMCDGGDQCPANCGSAVLPISATRPAFGGALPPIPVRSSVQSSASGGPNILLLVTVALGAIAAGGLVLFILRKRQETDSAASGSDDVLSN